MSEIDAIRARAAAATQGPWQWFGDVKHGSPYLATPHSGRLFIMTFERKGMQGAEPWFRTADGNMAPATDQAIYEVARDATSKEDPRLYRHDIVGFRNPDAEFIAHARQDIETLLALVDALTAELAEVSR